MDIQVAVRPYRRGSTARMIVDALQAKGYEVEYGTTTWRRRGVPQSVRVARFTIFGVNYILRNTHLYFAKPDGSLGSGVDGTAVRLFVYKDMVKSILRSVGVAVPEGLTFIRGDETLALRYFRHAKKHFKNGFCIKPVDGVQGLDVYVGVKSFEQFNKAFKSVSERWNRILVEEVIVGKVYRFTTVDKKVVAVRYGRPQNVVGDGLSSVEKLVDEKIGKRKKHLVFRMHPFPFGNEQLEFLASQGLSANSIPPKGKRVYLGLQSNSHAGADVIECMDAVHPSYIAAVERAISAMPRTVACGVDIMIDDIKVPANKGNHAVIELNTGPGFAASAKPWAGKRKDIGGYVVQHLEKIAREEVAGK